jgi:hypothetical protein
MKSHCSRCVFVYLLMFLFSVRSVSYQRKVGNYFFAKLLVTLIDVFRKQKNKDLCGDNFIISIDYVKKTMDKNGYFAIFLCM